jgi:signal recognition particle subunit SRP54
MFENLSDKLDRAFKVLKGQGTITEINVAETMKEIRKALLDADVNYKTAKTFTDEVRQKAIGQNVLTSISPGQLLTKIMNDELTELMGGSTAELNLSTNPTVILIAGLNGAGKTTFTGKLANYLKTSKNKKVLLVADDVYRPAAIEQLQVLGKQIDVPVYANLESTDPVAIAREGIALAKQNGHNVVIIDTAGRLSIDEAMMVEIENVKAPQSRTKFCSWWIP